MPILDPDERRRYQRKWMAQRRQEWFEANGPCVDCESWENLEVDHVDRNIKVTHRVWSWTKKRREAELAKCEVRCHSCHANRTAGQFAKTVCEYGHDMTILGYDNYRDGLGSGDCSECRRERQRRKRRKERK